MASDLTAVIAAAEALPEAERRELVEVLSAGLDAFEWPAGSVPQLTEAQKRMVDERMAEHDAGLAESATWEEIRARWVAQGRLRG